MHVMWVMWVTSATTPTHPHTMAQPPPHLGVQTCRCAKQCNMLPSFSKPTKYMPGPVYPRGEWLEGRGVMGVCGEGRPGLQRACRPWY